MTTVVVVTHMVTVSISVHRPTPVVDVMALNKGTWSITRSNASDVVHDDEFIDGALETYLLEIPCGASMRAGAVSFEQAFDADVPDHAFAEATLQMMMHALSLVRTKYDERVCTTTSTDVVGEPFLVFLETVLGSAPDPRMPLIVRVDDATRPFMRNVPDNIPVVAYRLWLFVRVIDEAYNYSRIFMESIKDAARAHAAYVTPGLKRTRADKPDADGDTGVSLASYAGPDGIKYGHQLGPNEKWRLLRSLELWAHVADGLLGFKRLGRFIAQITSNTTALNDNKANPRYVLSPYLYFEHPHADADPRQRELARYMIKAEGKRWTFAVPDRVVRVHATDQSIERLRKKIFPDYQVRSIGNDAVEREVLRQRQRAVARISRAIVGSGPNAVAERRMVHVDLPPGAAGDIDLLGLAPAALASPVDDEWDASLYDDNEAPRLRPRVQQVTGGVDYESIMRVIRSVPNTTPTGDFELVDGNMIAREDFEGSTSLAAQHLLSATDHPNRSPFHLVRHTGARLAADFLERMKSMSREEARAEYEQIRMRLFNDYSNTCCHRTDKVSAEGSAMNGWFEARVDEDRAWLGHEEPRLDADMSTFGNHIGRHMLLLENSFITFAHLIILTLQFGSLDAYRHAFDMHFNALLTGPNSAGKSHVFKHMAATRIDTTVKKVDTQTGKAMYVDTDHNDRINYSEEVKPDQFRDAKGGGNDEAEASWKEILTSMTRVLLTFTKLADGRRSSRIVYSQHIMTFFGASNIDSSSFTAAIQSRFSCIHMSETRRSDRCTEEMQGVEETLGHYARTLRREYVDEMCSEQYLHYHIEKLVAVHALTQVTTAAFDAIKQPVRRYLRERYNIVLKTRTLARAHMLVRKYVMTTRCAHLFSSPASPFFRTPFTIYQLMTLDELLYDDEEMACFALESLRHEIIDKERPHLMSLLDTAYVAGAKAAALAAGDAGIDVRMRAVYMMPLTKIKKTHAPSMLDNKRRRYADVAAESMTEAMMSTDAESTYSKEHMFAYYRFGLPLESLARRIAAASVRTAMQLSVEDVEKLIVRLSRDDILTDQYRWNSIVHAPEIDETRARVSLPAALITTDAIFIALQLFGATDPLTEAIAYARSSHLDRERKYITASILDSEHPYLLKTVTVRPDDGHDHAITDYGNQITASVYFGSASVAESDHITRDSISSAHTRLTVHYNELSRRARAKALHLDANDPAVCNVAKYDEYECGVTEPGDPMYLRRMRRYVLDEGGSYPAVILGAIVADDA